MKPLLNRNEIRNLLTKFYKGETSDQEEQLLRYYFHAEDVAPEFMAERDIFRAMHHAHEAEVPDTSFNELLNDSLAKLSSGSNIVGRRITLSRKWLSIAAALVLFMSIGALAWWQLKPAAPVQLADTYSDPEIAFAEAKRALLKVSTTLNKGTTPLNKLSKFNTNLDKVSTVSFFRPIIESRN